MALPGANNPEIYQCLQFSRTTGLEPTISGRCREAYQYRPFFKSCRHVHRNSWVRRQQQERECASDQILMITGFNMDNPAKKAGLFFCS